MFDQFTDRAKRSIVAAQDEAVALGYDFIGTEHLLLGLVAVPEATAGALLAESGVELDRAREVTVRLLDAAGIKSGGGQQARDALASLGIDVTEIQRRADDNFGEGAFQFPRPAYTEHAKAALVQTLREAKALGHERFGTEHMLLALLAVGPSPPEPAAVDVLAALDVDADALRPAVLTRLADGS
ncbi:ATP-dependent Clp protease ATP-binding subunit ClpA [Streptacidiphilus sp. MAP12-20]|uniref:Clp protease N-terminal domain-containing protein n=1 Tax=Streptacidiphilus sp. MAP12-20 TaxID=3156299 RepID=UPI0035188C6F